MTFHVFYTHVAPLGLGDMVIRHCYIHVWGYGSGKMPDLRVCVQLRYTEYV